MRIRDAGNPPQSASGATESRRRRPASPLRAERRTEQRLLCVGERSARPPLTSCPLAGHDEDLFLGLRGSGTARFSARSRAFAYTGPLEYGRSASSARRSQASSASSSAASPHWAE